MLTDPAFFADDLPTIKVEGVDDDSSIDFSEADCSPEIITRPNPECSVHTVSVHTQARTVVPMIRIEGVRETSLESSEADCSPTRRSSGCSVCSHTVSLHAEATVPEGTPENLPFQFSDPDGWSAFVRSSERASRRSSDSSICSRTVSIHSETSAVNVAEVITRKKSCTTLQVPGNPAEEISSSGRKSSSSTSVVTSLDIELEHAHNKGSSNGICNSDGSGQREQSSARDPLEARRFRTPEHEKVSRKSTFSRSSSDANELKVQLDHDSCQPNSVQFHSSEDYAVDRGSKTGSQAVCHSGDLCQGLSCTSPEDKAKTRRENVDFEENVKANTTGEDEAYGNFFDMRHSESYNFSQHQGPWLRFKGVCLKIAQSIWFTYFIMGVILVNMIFMGLEHYKQVRESLFLKKLSQY